jgi:hypothetical protein
MKFVVFDADDLLFFNARKNIGTNNQEDSLDTSTKIENNTFANLAEALSCYEESQKCDKCKGIGTLYKITKNTGTANVCDICHGMGKVPTKGIGKTEISHISKHMVDCDLCNGAGFNVHGSNGDIKCKKCNGSGEIESTLVIEGWKPIDTALMNTPVFIKDEDGDIGIGVCCEIVRNYRDLGVVRNKAWKIYFNTLGDPKFWLPINWPEV